MPPRSIASAVALVGLCSLAAVETGGCSNSSKSLASVTRTGLPLLSAALNGPIAELSLRKLNLFPRSPACPRAGHGADNATTSPEVDNPKVIESVVTHASVDAFHQVGCLGPGPNNGIGKPMVDDDEVSEPFVENGLGPVSELSPHCGRYEIKGNGGVVAWDALVSRLAPEQIVATLVERDRTLNFSHEANGVWVADRKVLGKTQHVQVHANGVAKLPENCRELANSVRSVVIVSEAL